MAGKREHDKQKNEAVCGGESLVSVVMAVCNEPPAVVRTSIQSIMDQTYQNFELLIYDDSTDGATREAVDLFAGDGRVKVIREKERMGFAHALNLGLHEARGAYIARMDGDDISLPERLEKEASYLERHKDVYVLGGQVDIIDESGRVVSERKYPLGGGKLFFFSAVRNPLAHPAVMMRRELVEEGFSYDESLEMSEDLDLWLRIMNHSHRIANLPDKVLAYRVSGNFADKRTGKKQASYMAGVRWKNFSRRHLLHSCLSAAAAGAFFLAPKGAVRKMYDRENGRGRTGKRKGAGE